ncbi:glycosyltransferase [Pseudozobellia sp. WGM2]|uniref:glycosyltransferase family 4 protein n=1 Tax=Pseudozobellia sp. WGM2 TaxID=2787625 RepID=UPI001AE01881
MLGKYVFENNKGVFIVAQSWPCMPYGGSIAITASLRQYCKFFDDVVFICLGKDEISQNAAETFPTVHFHFIHVHKKSLTNRFLRSIFFNRPAITLSMGANSVFYSIVGILSTYLTKGNLYKYVGIVEDNVPGIHLIKLKERYPNMLWAFKSHDVLHKAFSMFKSTGNPFFRLAWWHEIGKIYQFEYALIKTADVKWAITKDDLILSEKCYETNFDGVFDSDIDLSRYENIRTGKLNNIIYLGSADSRKGHGIKMFIKNVWPQLLDRYSNRIELTLGGRQTEIFHNQKIRVSGVGFINDEITFLGKGAIFINPQVAGSGLKLKSIIAMAAGKVLVTTENGALGLDGIPGKHYCVAKSDEHMIQIISHLIDNPTYVKKIALDGQEFAKERFSRQAFSERVQPLLIDYWKKAF